MAKRKIIRTLITMIFLSSCLLLNSQFTESRVKKKGPTIGTLREECCQGFAAFLDRVPLVLESIAKLQKIAIEAIAGYWQSDKQSLCFKASRQKLHDIQSRIDNLINQTNHLVEQYHQIVNELKVDDHSEETDSTKALKSV